MYTVTSCPCPPRVGALVGASLIEYALFHASCRVDRQDLPRTSRTANALLLSTRSRLPQLPCESKRALTAHPRLYRCRVNTRYKTFSSNVNHYVQLCSIAKTPDTCEPAKQFVCLFITCSLCMVQSTSLVGAWASPWIADYSRGYS